MTCSEEEGRTQSAASSASELLEAAQAALDERGWYQGDLEDAATGRVCAMGALHLVTFGAADPKPSMVHGTSVERRDAFSAAFSLLDAEAKRLGGTAPAFYNDREATTKEDVLLLFKRAAERAREAGQ